MRLFISLHNLQNEQGAPFFRRVNKNHRCQLPHIPILVALFLGFVACQGFSVSLIHLGCKFVTSSHPKSFNKVVMFNGLKC